MKPEEYKTIKYEPGHFSKITHIEGDKRSPLIGDFVLEFKDFLSRLHRNKEAIFTVLMAEGRGRTMESFSQKRCRNLPINYYQCKCGNCLLLSESQFAKYWLISVLQLENQIWKLTPNSIQLMPKDKTMLSSFPYLHSKYKMRRISK